MVLVSDSSKVDGGGQPSSDRLDLRSKRRSLGYIRLR
jgi:hypothetical protein